MKRFVTTLVLVAAVLGVSCSPSSLSIRKKVTSMILYGHDRAVFGVAYHPKDPFFFISGGFDRHINFWNRKGGVYRRIKAHSKPVFCLAYSPNGQLIASGSADRTICIWDKEGNKKRTLRGHRDTVLSVAFSPNNNQLLSGSEDRTAILWNLEKDHYRVLRGHVQPVSAVAFPMYEENRFATASRDKTIRVYQDSIDNPRILRGHSGPIYGLAFSRDGGVLASGSSDGTLRLWDRKGKPLRTIRAGTSVWCVAFSRHGDQVICGLKDGRIKIYNTNGKLLNTLSGHSMGVISLAVNSSGSRFASASNDRTIRLWY